MHRSNPKDDSDEPEGARMSGLAKTVKSSSAPFLEGIRGVALLPSGIVLGAFFWSGSAGFHWTSLLTLMLIVLMGHQFLIKNRSSVVSFCCGFPTNVALVFALTLVGCVLLSYGSLYLASDDPYIYLGYVKSIERGIPGGLFSYNVGEYSAGTTGVLYYYLLLCMYLFLVPHLTFFLDPPQILVLSTYLLNVTLWAFTFHNVAFLFQGIFKEQRDARIPMCALVFLASTLVSPLAPDSLAYYTQRFNWGFWGGLEGSLMAVLLSYLARRVAHDNANWTRLGNLASSLYFLLAVIALPLARPEFLPVALTLSLPALIMGLSKSDKKALRHLLVAWSIFGVLLLPLKINTGSFVMSALGSRVPSMRFDLGLLIEQMLKNTPILFQSGWVLIAAVLLVVSLIRRNRTSALLLAVPVLTFGIRAMFGLLKFNVMDRYISYMFILYVVVAFILLGDLPIIRTTLARLGGLLMKHRISWGASLLGMLLYAGWAGDQFFGSLRLDIDEMNEVVVEPSKWMASHLPSGARVCMEPAGAIRVWTDFYLVDTVGLTTYHLRELSKPDMIQLIRRNDVDYCFIYPHVAIDWRRSFPMVREWKVKNRRYSGGSIALFDTQPRR